MPCVLLEMNWKNITFWYRNRNGNGLFRRKISRLLLILVTSSVWYSRHQKWLCRPFADRRGFVLSTLHSRSTPSFSFPVGKTFFIGHFACKSNSECWICKHQHSGRQVQSRLGNCVWLGEGEACLLRGWNEGRPIDSAAARNRRRQDPVRKKAFPRHQYGYGGLRPYFLLCRSAETREIRRGTERLGAAVLRETSGQDGISPRAELPRLKPTSTG